MKNNYLILDLFNKVLRRNFFQQNKISAEELGSIEQNFQSNTNINNVFDSILDIIVFSVGASYKLQLLTNKYLDSLEQSRDEYLCVKRIVDWNKKRNLNVFNFKRELAFILEEVYEGTFLNHTNSHDVSLQIVDKYFKDLIFEFQSDFKLVQNFFIDIYKSFFDLGRKYAELFEEKNVYFYLNKVMDANDKKGSTTDVTGKIIKDKEQFIPPEKSFVNIKK